MQLFLFYTHTHTHNIVLEDTEFIDWIGEILTCLQFGIFTSMEMVVFLNQSSFKFFSKIYIVFSVKVLCIIPDFFIIFYNLLNRICFIYSNWLLLVGKKDVKIVLGRSGCYNKNTGGFNNKHLFLTVLETEKAKFKAWGDSVSDKDLIPEFIESSCLLIVSCLAEKAIELSGVCFIRALIPFIRAPPPWPNHHSKAPALISIALRLGCQYLKCWENTNSL